MIFPAALDLFAAAMGELASRRKHLPAKVDRSEMTAEEAEADILCWRTIATMLRHGNGPDGEGRVLNPLLMIDGAASWAELDLAASRALIARSARADADPADPARARHRDDAQAIHALVTRHRAFWEAGARAQLARAA